MTNMNRTRGLAPVADTSSVQSVAMARIGSFHSTDHRPNLRAGGKDAEHIFFQ